MLIIPIWVNNHEIRRIELVRVDPIHRQPEEGDECTYALRYFRGDPNSTEALIRHLYLPNNPLPLTIAALRMVQDLDNARSLA